MTDFIVGLKAIRTAGREIQVQSKSLDAAIQQWAISAIAHINDHGDIDMLTDMFDGNLGKGVRVNALKEYIDTFAKVTYNEKSKCFMYDKTSENDTAAAAKRHWTEFKPDPEFKSMNSLTMLSAVLSKMDKLAKEELQEGQSHQIDDDHRNALERLIAELSAPSLDGGDKADAATDELPVAL